MSLLRVEVLSVHQWKFLYFTDGVHSWSAINGINISDSAKQLLQYNTDISNKHKETTRVIKCISPRVGSTPQTFYTCAPKGRQQLNYKLLFPTKSLHCNPKADLSEQQLKAASVTNSGEKWAYLLGALPIDHGWGWWWGQDWEFGAEKLARLQRCCVVCHVSLIHTTEEVLLQQRHSDQWIRTKCTKKVCDVRILSLGSDPACADKHIHLSLLQDAASLSSLSAHPECTITYICKHCFF